jgi:hypothetical protein
MLKPIFSFFEMDKSTDEEVDDNLFTLSEDE